MAAKYRKLHPDQLLKLAQEVAAALRAVVATEHQARAAAPKMRAQCTSSSEYHQFVHAAREFNAAMRSLSDLGAPMREELFQAARAVRAAHRQRRQAAPKCGAQKASGGRCGTRLEPGQFRCPLHAQELRRRREERASPVPRKKHPS